MNKVHSDQGSRRSGAAQVRQERLKILRTGKLGPKDFMKLTGGVSYRQAQYRDKTGGLQPSERRGKDDKYRQYIFWDVVRQEIANFLHQNHYAPQKVYDHPTAKGKGAASVGLLTMIVKELESRSHSVLVEECVLYLRRAVVPLELWDTVRCFFFSRGWIGRISDKVGDPLEGEWIVFDLKVVVDKFITAVVAKRTGTTEEV